MIGGENRKFIHFIIISFF